MINKFLGGMAASLLLASTAQAASVLYYRDASIATDAMGAALDASAHAVTRADSQSDFRGLVQNGGWDLVVYFQQSYSAGTGADTAIAQWVAGGGRAIFADWDRTAAIASLFGASYTGTNNQTQLSFDLLGNATLSNPGWDVFSMGLSAHVDATATAWFANGQDAVVFGNGGRTVLNGFLNDTLPLEFGIALFSSQVEQVLAAPVQQVPEPAGMGLTVAGACALAMARRRRRARVAGALVLASAAATANAALIRVDFAGAVTNHGGDMVAALPLGTAGAGYFVYDSAAAATGWGSDNTRYDGALVDYRFSVGGYEYRYSTGTQALAWVFDESPLGDRFDLGDWAGTGDSIAGHALVNWGLLLGRDADGITQGTALPGTDWYTPGSGIIGTLLVDHGAWPGDHRYQVQVTTLSFTEGSTLPDPGGSGPDEPVQQVPEPASAGLVATAAAALGYLRRRTPRAQQVAKAKR